MNCSQCGQALDSRDKLCRSCGKAADPAEPAQAQARPFPRGFEMVCLMSGIALTNDIRKELYKAACEMGQKGRKKEAIKHPDFEGTITTDLNYCAFSGMGGVKFTADIEADTEKGKVVFLVTNFDYAEDGIWLPVMALPQSHPAAKAQYN